MNRLIYCLLLIIEILFFSNSALSATTSIWTGKWEYVQHVPSLDKPYSIFDLFLNQNEKGDVQGSYCFVTQSGNRVDCDRGGELNVNGHASGSSKNIDLYFDTFSGAKNGVASVSLNDDGSLVWNVVKKPQGGEYYGPGRAIFHKIGSARDVQNGFRPVTENKAYLYNSPSPSERSKIYVIKGDNVKLISVSADLKFWKIEFITKNRIAIDKWIDCRDIDSCAQ